MQQSLRVMLDEDGQANIALRNWYKKVDHFMKNPKKNTKYTPEQKDAKMRELKIGKYREWEFNIDRWNEICEEVADFLTDKAMNMRINYVRNFHPEYNDLSDEELITRGLHNLLYLDKAEDRKKARKERLELEQDYKEQLLQIN